eukprot:149792_1
MVLNILLFISIISNSIEFASTLCSSTEYSNKIRNILSKQNDYDVYEGQMVFFQNKSYPQQNPNGIYGGVYFNTKEISTNDITKYSYWLRASNALLFSGCTPPKAKYFSLVSYINRRYHYISDNQTHHSIQLFASLSAALNNLIWNTTSQNISSNYNSLTTVIQTADQQTWNKISKLLFNNGISKQEINLHSLPNEYIHFVPYECNGNDIFLCQHTYDTGMWIFRITLPENLTDYEKYISTNQTVFMLQPKDINKNSSEPTIAYNISIRNVYSRNNYNETSSIYVDVLKQYKMDLINYFTSVYNMSFVNEKVFNDPFGSMCDNQTLCYGFICIAQMFQCYGDNRDGRYYGPGSLYIGKNNFYVMLGVIHSNNAIKQTIYSNIVYMYQNSLSSHIDPAISNSEYNGSGLVLPVNTSVDEEYLKNIFVVQAAAIENCIYIDELSDKLCIKNKTLPVVGTIEQRHYLNPITKTRPDYNEIIPSIVLNFTLNG